MVMHVGTAPTRTESDETTSNAVAAELVRSITPMVGASGDRLQDATPDDGSAFWVAYGSIVFVQPLRGTGEVASLDVRSPTLPGAGHAPGGFVQLPRPGGDVGADVPDSRVVADADPSGDQARVRFLDGYRASGGPHEYEQHLIEVVIPCEYGWGEYVKVNYYESRAQFDPQSWQTAGGGDPADDFQVGANVARWIALIGDPGGSGGWGCWGG